MYSRVWTGHQAQRGLTLPVAAQVRDYIHHIVKFKFLILLLVTLFEHFDKCATSCFNEPCLLCTCLFLYMLKWCKYKLTTLLSFQLLSLICSSFAPLDVRDTL